MQDDSLHLDLFTHSLSTPKPLSMHLHVFSYSYWLETELQMILLVLVYSLFFVGHNRFCSILAFIFKHISLDVYTEIADAAIFSCL